MHRTLRNPGVESAANALPDDCELEEGSLTQVVPFLIEDMLVTNGCTYTKGADWQSYVVTDGLLITGQNPASSEAAAQALLKLAGTA